MLKLYYGDAVKPAPSHSVRLEGKVYMSTVNGQLRYVLYAPTDTILYDIRDTFRELWEGPDCNTLFNRLDLCIRARTIKRPELKHIYLYGDMLVLRADFGRFENKDVVQVDVFDKIAEAEANGCIYLLSEEAALKVLRWAKELAAVEPIDLIALLGNGVYSEKYLETCYGEGAFLATRSCPHCGSSVFFREEDDEELVTCCECGKRITDEPDG